jgi:DNA mismatch endonuclease (patch repair protein)
MTDVFNKAKRSEVMSHIRGSGNKDTELVLINLMRRAHITGWRRNQALPGKPDFTFRRESLVIFVDGCFWHGCPKHATFPRNNAKFWQRKLDANKARDKFVTRTLKKSGWYVLRIWEHELKKPQSVIKRISMGLNKKRQKLRPFLK